MKNYQKVLMAVAFGLFAKDLFPQGAYLNVNAGYGWRMGAQSEIASYETQYFGSGNSNSTYKVQYVSFGKGLNFGGAFGYMFNENIGAEIGVSYLLGGKTTAKSSDVDNSGSFPYSRTEEYAWYSRMLRLNPSIVLSMGNKKIKPYAKFGMIIGKGKIHIDASSSEMGGMSDPEIRTQKMEYYGGLALGCSSAFGAIYSLSDKLSLFGELNVITLSYAPTKGKMTENMVNGVDQLPQMKTYEKEIEFLDSYTEDNYGNQPVETEPSKDLKTKMPFGSMGLNVGLRISF